jgi:hypothetical protein
MATRSNIAYRNTQGKIISIYSHWDGYPEHNGELLRRFYNTQDKVEALIALGSISSLGQDIGKQVDFDDRDTHTETGTIAYHRDRGEPLSIAEYDDIPSWIADMEEYAYLWNGKEWIVNDHGEGAKTGYPVFNFVEDVVNAEHVAKIFGETA